MSKSTRGGRTQLRWIALVILGVPAGVLAGITPQGITPQGITPQGITPQGITPQGITPQGITPQGITPQGITPQGITPQGITPQGITPQGITPQGVAFMGTDLLSGEGKGVLIKSVTMHGKASGSPEEDHALTRIPTMSTGSGNYIAVGTTGESAVGHYAVAHLADAHNMLVDPPEDLDLYIADGKKDPKSNLFHRFEEQDNEDWIYQVYFFHKWSGQWISLCPYDANTKMASAVALPQGAPGDFIFACTAVGVDSKCARNWGYRPWADTTAWVFSGGAWALQSFGLKDYYEACTHAAMAGYCQDEKSYTKTGTLVDLYDTRQIIWPNAIENPFSGSNPDSQWMMAQEYFISTGASPKNPSIKDSALQRTRYKELSPSAECKNFAFIGRLERDHTEDNRWANPSTDTPRLQVFSPTYCTHNEYTDGDPIPWDCTPCTTQVCKDMPECCGAGATPHWGPACIGKALSVCQTNGTQWPKGRVWPRDIDTSGPVILPKYLFGPQGAVVRVEGTSGTSSSATVSGWACDPEWPDSTVAVEIYNAPRETVVGPPLAIVQADKALASPLAREVSAACDGPGRDYAHHGFSFTLPHDLSGNVFVYALDQDTADGVGAPPTLIRNGIVHVPRCAHSEHVAGEALDPGCSACAGSVCTSDATCCSTAWTDACADLADACVPTDSSAPANSRVFAAVTTGWIEAPSDGAYTFDSSVQPSRLFINGTAVLDWFEATSPGTKQGSITLKAGQKYHLRWDRLQTETPVGSDPGLTWQPPGAVGQVPIPSENLYALAPGGGTGLKASYFDDLNLSGTEVDHFAPAPDPVVDINHNVQPPTPVVPVDIPASFTLPYSAKWEGQLIPSFSEDYTFIVVGNGASTLKINGVPVSVIGTPSNSAPGGCGHDLCELGPKLDASCNWCVQKVCAQDDYCCNGGYLSYYSFGDVWDSKCIADVNQYCGAGFCSTPPVGGAMPQTKLGPVTLQAGVRYDIELVYNSDATDKTVQLMWTSERQVKQVVPQFALYPRDPGASGRGAGLNVTYFGTTTVNNVIKADLATVTAVGFVSDFSLTPTIGQTGTPLVDLFASIADLAAATPPPPTLERPRYGDVVSDTTPQIVVTGIGGLPGGTVRFGLASDPTVAVIATVGGDGKFTATVPVGAYGAQILKMIQRAPAATCVVPTTGACSYELTWPVTVVEATAATKPPALDSPKDPTHIPNPLANVIPVIGTGTTADLHITDQGSYPDLLGPITPASDGSFSGSITLTAGDAATPLKGWHKLIFDQGGTPTPPVFVSVGIDPPMVEFPRSGAEIDCTEPDPDLLPPAVGTVPYTEAQLGPLWVMEETGRDVLGDIGAQTGIFPPANPGDPLRFQAYYSLGPGKHVLVFFQAPVPPSSAERNAHLRAFSQLADTPTSRIVVNVPPKRFQVPDGASTVLRPQVLYAIGSSADCSAPPATNAPGLLCALPFADVNVRVGKRVYTVRANDKGVWRVQVPDLPQHGWNDVTIAQVADSSVGGAWSESCLSNTIQVGYESLDGFIDVPPDMQVDATGPDGAQVFYPDVTARTGANEPLQVDCVPRSGSVFPIGTTFVHCSAPNPATGDVVINGFRIKVVAGPPQIKASDLTLEATSSLGATLGAYTNVSVVDLADPAPAIDCAPAAPHLFLLDQTMPVVCTATDKLNLSATAQFNVQVSDTTPPNPCTMPDLKVGTNSGSGAIVNYTVCNASDVVDGAVPMACDRAPGSFFPLGSTLVTCTATDRHANKSAPTTFTVSVGDTTPPVLKLPGTLSAIATSRSGARVGYTVTATDNVDPNPTVKCTPPSGSIFPLGATTVNCTATDAAGNKSTGKFVVKVTVAWTGLLAPVNQDGSSRFPLGLPIALRFALTGASANICDLPAKLFVAPLDASGKPGTERPAAGLPPGAGNLFYFIPIINQYAMLLDTRPLSLGPWQLRVDLGDGENHTQRITMVRF
jgi:hypothetical protein